MLSSLETLDSTLRATHVCADMRLSYATLAPSMMSISPPLGQSGPYIQTIVKQEENVSHL